MPFGAIPLSLLCLGHELLLDRAGCRTPGLESVPIREEELLDSQFADDTAIFLRGCAANLARDDRLRSAFVWAQGLRSIGINLVVFG